MKAKYHRKETTGKKKIRKWSKSDFVPLNSNKIRSKTCKEKQDKDLSSLKGNGSNNS